MGAPLHQALDATIPLTEFYKDKKKVTYELRQRQLGLRRIRMRILRRQLALAKRKKERENEHRL